MGIVSSKECFKCHTEKPLSEFYKHSSMADGHLGKCKECNKRDVRDNRELRVDYYRRADRERGSRQIKEYRKEKRLSQPIAYKARTMVGNAIRDGRLHKEPCEKCGVIDGVHAHHDDYLKPLNIRWLCVAHHSQWHKENGEGKNARPLSTIEE